MPILEALKIIPEDARKANLSNIYRKLAPFDSARGQEARELSFVGRREKYF